MVRHVQRWLVASILGLLMVAPGAAAAASDGPHVEILHDLGPDRTTRAGVVNTLGWVLVNDEGKPAFHQDAVFEVTFEGETILKTTPSSGHDYDGVDPYSVAFPGPGTFTVHAEVHDDGEIREATLTGQVLPAPSDAARIEATVPASTETGEQTQLTYSVLGPDGEPVEHADVTVRVRRAMDGFEVLHTTTHAHDGTHAITYAFERTGTFEVVLTATPVAGEGDPGWSPAAVTRTINVAQGEPETTPPNPPMDRPLVNDRETGSSDDPYRLFGTYDPYTSVGPHGRLRLGMLTLDAETGTPVENVSYEATMLGPSERQVFQSGDLFAPDGFTYVTTSRPDVGRYQLRVHAMKGDWSASTTLAFSVLPPAAAANPAALFATPNSTATPTAGQPTTIPIQVDDAAGVPLLHGEVDWRVVDASTGVPIYEGKLHTHENGTFPLTVTYPTEGDYRLEIAPQSLQPTPTPFTWGESVGQPPMFDVAVEPGEPLGIPDEPVEPTSTDDANGTPAPGVVLLLALIGLAAIAIRRRDR